MCTAKTYQHRQTASTLQQQVCRISLQIFQELEPLSQRVNTQLTPAQFGFYEVNPERLDSPQLWLSGMEGVPRNPLQRAGIQGGPWDHSWDQTGSDGQTRVCHPCPMRHNRCKSAITVQRKLPVRHLCPMRHNTCGSATTTQHRLPVCILSAM